MHHAFHVIWRPFLICFVLAAIGILLAGGWLAGLCVLAAAGWLVRGRVTIQHFTLWLLIGGFLLRVAVILVLNPPIISDFGLMFEASQSLLAGDFSFQQLRYFSLWAYQSGFVAWQAMLLAIWNNPLIIKLANALLSAGTVCLLYRLARDHVRESAAQAAMLLLTAFPFALTLPTVLTNQISSAFFLTLGVWLLACYDCTRLGFWRFPLAGLALQAGNLLRSEGVILVVAVLAYAVFAVLQRPNMAKRMVCGMAALLVVYGAVGVGADAAVRASGLNANGTANGYPGWKFVTGLNFSTSGGYSTDDWNQLSATFDENGPTEATYQVQDALISERLSAGPKALLLHAAHKCKLLWCNDALDWAFGHLQLHDCLTLIYDNIQKMDRMLFYAALLLAVFGVYRPRRTAAAYLPLFVVFAAFCAFLLIEVQPRYAHLPQLFLFCGASLGFDRLIGKEENHA
ncbi:glycosyltransferase family 39 protein [uncultured Agathobaculum sp.]|uniref:glycosyltransferase family 39 protein n=1 Tax=uncultured Agathobaculum sp. TaxID=2048140 RepID=UPI0032089300